MKDVTIYDDATGEVIYEADEDPAGGMTLTWDGRGVFTIKLDDEGQGR